MKPNKKNIKKWVEALESGKYLQGMAQLRTPRTESYSGKTEYCCLGVAASVGGFTIKDEKLLPPRVQKWLGIEEKNPKLEKSNGRSSYASDLNDVYRLTFPEIAQCIRRTYLSK